MKLNKKSLVIFSGGQDSTTCLYWAKKHFDKVYAITFVYGQQHNCEIQQSKIICEKEKIPQKIVDISFYKDFVISELVKKEGDFKERHPQFGNLPSSFVPLRNQLFLTLTYAWATKIEADNIVMGVCQTDYSGYPDCRDNFIKGFQALTNFTYGLNIVIHTPLMFLTKGETFLLADKLGCLDEVIKLSHTCYKGDREHFHPWGYGCGECPACKLRAKGWQEYLNLKEFE